MYIPVPLLIVLAAALLLLLAIVVLRRRGGGRDDLMRPPQGLGVSTLAGRPAPAAPQPLPPELESEVRALIGRRRKIDAIKLVRERTQLGLKEAKELVERMGGR